MKTVNVSPGDIVVSDFGMYQHWSIVSDATCQKGLPMLISATQRNGTVKEEPWDVVTGGKRTYVADATLQRDRKEVLTLARSEVGTWVYSVTSRNCEHFVKWAAGLQVTSKQVNAGMAGAVGGALLVGMLSEKPTMAKFLGGAILLGGLAVASARALEKRDQQPTLS